MKVKFVIVCCFFLLVVALALCNGAVPLTVSQLLEKGNQPILLLRLFRILIGVVCGSGLAVAGIVLQAILRNWLAEPYLLGTSSGAGLGAVICILLGVSRLYLPAAAFIGALVSMAAVYVLARQNHKLSEQSLILSGVIVSVGLSAVMVFLISTSPNEALHGMTWWLWGSLQVYDFRLLMLAGLIVFIGIGVIFFFAQDLNAISMGEEAALHVGIDIEKVKRILLIVTAVMTASVVSLCGIIGFVGLIIPHMMRFVVGPNHRRLIPASVVAASIFMIACDTVARTFFAPIEIPIGVVTAILGAPTFMYLLKRRTRMR
jgi:iron complex transport system permease protein